MMEIITRAEAKERGLKHYFTGCPCKHGHVAVRSTVNGTCMHCYELTHKGYDKTHRQRHGATIRAKGRSYVSKNREKLIAQRKINLETVPGFREKIQTYKRRYKEKVRLDASLDAYLDSLSQDKPW